jgi:hypothetical protein
MLLKPYADPIRVSTITAQPLSGTIERNIPRSDRFNRGKSLQSKAGEKFGLS